MASGDAAPPRVKPPTIADVARHANTSRGTVSFVINNRPGVAPTTRERVLRSMRELNWTPNPLARSLSTSRAYALGLILARDPHTLGADPFFAPFIAGVEAGLEGSGMSLVLRFSPNEAAETIAYESLTSHHRVDGFLITDLRENDRRLALLASLKMPAVSLNQADAAPPVPAVIRPDEPGIVAAVEYLISLGHTRIAHVSGPMLYLHAQLRYRAWASTMSTHGLDISGLLMTADFTAAGGSSATRQLMALPLEHRPTAVVYANDLMAVAGMSVIQKGGFRIPQDVSVIGFDDAELSAYLNPPLTTVRTEPYDWGVCAAQSLIELIESGDSTSRELKPAELIIRESAGPAPTS